jgi:hypothetical protein
MRCISGDQKRERISSVGDELSECSTHFVVTLDGAFHPWTPSLGKIVLSGSTARWYFKPPIRDKRRSEAVNPS